MRVAPSGTLAEHSATCLPLAEREHVRVTRRQDPRLHPASFLFSSSFTLAGFALPPDAFITDRKSTRLNSSHLVISYAVFCLKKKKKYYSVKIVTSLARQ